jgi:hypothetical protein
MQGRNLVSLLSRGSPSLRAIGAACAPKLFYSRVQSVTTPASLRLLSTLPNLPLFRALKDHDSSSLAVVHSASLRSFTYGNLVADVLQAKGRLLGSVGGRQDALSGERVAFLAENSYDYVGTVSLLCPWRILYKCHGWITRTLASWLILTCSNTPLYPCEQCDCSPSFPCVPCRRTQVYSRQLPGQGVGRHSEVRG